MSSRSVPPRNVSRSRAQLLARCISGALTLAGSAAGAQSASDNATVGDESAALEEVTVTGSRIARRDFVANSPITTASREFIDASGAVTLEAALDKLPQFGLGSTATAAAFSGTGLATLNMRGLGPYRNLVLVDGRRAQPSTILGVVDLNTIPRALIEDIEIISGGASAVYGSDAVSGVVNIKLKERFTGLQIDPQITAYEHGGGQTTDVAVTLGSNFAEDRGNALLSLSYTDREEVGFTEREFFRRHQGGTDFRLPTGVYRPALNLPAQAALDAVFGSYGAAAGRVPRNSMLGFNDDGTLFSASNGPYNYRGSDTLLYNTGRQLNNLNQFSILQVPLERYTAFARGTYELVPAVESYAQVSYSRHDTTTIAEAGNNALTVPVTNPFIPQDLRAILASRADPGAPFTLDKRYQEAGPRVFNREFDAYQLIGGLRGEAAFLDGTWDVYASRGSTRFLESNPGSVLISSLNALINAPDGGASLCDGGYNPFGVQPLSAACRDYLVSTPLSKTTLDQDIIEGTLQGRLADLPAGELRFAVGAGYRKNSYRFQPDSELARGNVVGVFRTEPSSGSTSVRELYAELLVPVLSGAAFADELEVDLAYRYSDHDTAGGVDTYKADLNWRIVTSFGLRGGYQRAVRAPSVGELYVAPNVAIPGIGNVASGGGDPCHFQSQARSGADAAAVRALCVAQGVPVGLIDSFDNLQNEVLATNVGNVRLQPEVADTYTFGAVFNSPLDHPLARQLSVSIDYYDIQLDGAISSITAPQSIPKCFNRDGSNPTLAADNFFCGLITRDATTGVFVDVAQPTLNVGAYRTSGIDLQLNWTAGLDALGLGRVPGSLSVDAVVSRLDSFEIQTQQGGSYAQYAGTVGSPSASQPGSLPEWKALTTLTYRNDLFTVGARWRFIDAMRDASIATNPASTIPGVPSVSYVDLFGRCQLSEAFELHAGVNNVADEQPPVLRATPGTTEPNTYDVLGRAYYLGLTTRF
jgi:iron complex outermembrane recepter protein